MFDSPSNFWNVVVSGDPLITYTIDRQFPPEQRHTMNVLVLGCDSDYYDDKPVPIKGTNGRSDAIMVAHLDFDKNTINLLSIPRDTAVQIPGHRGYQKVNAAHAFGGNDLSTKTIQQDFGITSDYTVSLDFDSFKQVVDAVHGVDLTVDKKLDYDDNWANLHIHLKPGYQHLNGYHAMGFVRIRHTDDDFHRQERQHQFVEALRKKVTDPQNFMLLPDVLKAITDDLKSNLNQDQMLALVNWSRKLPKENIQLATLPGYEGRSFVYADPVKDAPIIAKLFFNGDVNQVTLHVGTRDQLALSNRKRRRRRRTHVEVNTPPVVPASDRETSQGAGDGAQGANSQEGAAIDTGKSTDTTKPTDPAPAPTDHEGASGGDNNGASGKEQGAGDKSGGGASGKPNEGAGLDHRHDARIALS